MQDFNSKGDHRVDPDVQDDEQPSSDHLYDGFMPVGSKSDRVSAHQVVDLIPKCGVIPVITPGGAAHGALIDHLAGLLSGKEIGPMGSARYPGDVLVLSKTLAENEFLRRHVPQENQPCGRVFSKRTRAFNWRAPLRDLTLGRSAELPHGERTPVAGRPDKSSVAAVILDIGPVAAAVKDEHVTAAEESLLELAHDLDCVILLVVESLVAAKDPFARIPSQLRGMREAILICPVKGQELDAVRRFNPEFLLLALAYQSPTGPVVQFSVTKGPDGRMVIAWGRSQFVDPRQALRMVELDDLKGAQLRAAQLAHSILMQHGPQTREDLIAAVVSQGNCAPSTVRDALTAARASGYFDMARIYGKQVWVIAQRPTPSLLLRPDFAPGLFTSNI